MILFRNVWRKFETEFDEILQAVHHHTGNLEQEITLSYRSVTLHGLGNLFVQASTTNKHICKDEVIFKPYSYKNFLKTSKSVASSRLISLRIT